MKRFSAICLLFSCLLFSCLLFSCLLSPCLLLIKSLWKMLVILLYLIFTDFLIGSNFLFFSMVMRFFASSILVIFASWFLYL